MTPKQSRVFPDRVPCLTYNYTFLPESRRQFAVSTNTHMFNTHVQLVEEKLPPELTRELNYVLAIEIANNNTKGPAA